MNRDQKAVAIAEIASHIDESEAIFAVDYRGITVAQVAELRAKLREADATFKVVKNSLTERAADQVGAESLKDFLAGPTALTFVRGDIATAAKAVADYARATQLLPFKGGLMDGATLDVDQIRSALPTALPRSPVRPARRRRRLARSVASCARSAACSAASPLPSARCRRRRSPARSRRARRPPPRPQRRSKQTPAAEAAPAPEEPPAENAPEAEAQTPTAEEPAVEESPAEDGGGRGGASRRPRLSRSPPSRRTGDGPAEEDDKQADVSAESEPKDAETNPTKED